MQVGTLALLALCQQGDMYSFVNAKFTNEHFINEKERDVWNLVRNHVEQHNMLPQVETLVEALSDTVLPKVVEPTEVYLKLIEDRFIQRTLKKGIKELADTLIEKGASETIQQMEHMLGEMLLSRQKQRMELFAPDGLDLSHQIMVKKKTGNYDEGLTLGWPTFDAMAEGLQPGDVVSYVGRPGTGKSWLLLYLSHYLWWKQKKSVLFMSMEMAIRSMMMRLSSLHSQVSIRYMKSGELSDWAMHRYQKAASAAKKHPAKIWVVDGNLSSTPMQVYALANHLKPDLVVIDGAYMLRNPNPRLGRYERVAENIEEIKRLTSMSQMPTVCSFQFNRQASVKKKKPDQKVGLEDIGYSDAIGQISSVVLGLFEPDMPDTTKMRTVEVLKGREGQTGSFYVNWNFDQMDFSEVSEDKIPTFV